MRVLVLGAGSVGSLLAAYLALGGHEVTAVGRKEHVGAVACGGLRLHGPDDSVRVVENLDAWVRLDSSWSAEPDVVLVCVKTHANVALAEQYAWLFERNYPTFLVQNGMGNEEPYLSRFPGLPVGRMLTSNGALRPAPGEVVHTGLGLTEVGALTSNLTRETVDELVAALDGSGLPAQVTGDVVSAGWKKLLVNVGINPFGALTGLRNGQLLQRPDLVTFMLRAVEEAERVARLVHPAFPEGDYGELVLDVARRTSNNKNSMLQDIEAGRPTEIQAINGHVVREGRRLGVDVPVNAMLVALVEGLSFGQMPV
ncbi:MAG: 2-dehydropantoate 2-reductase [Promethearchaeota archaeon]